VRILRKSAHDSKTTQRKTFFVSGRSDLYFLRRPSQGYKMHGEANRRKKSRSENAAAL
jgi:hypothetical protein